MRVNPSVPLRWASVAQKWRQSWALILLIPICLAYDAKQATIESCSGHSSTGTYKLFISKAKRRGFGRILESWLNLQTLYNLEGARERREIGNQTIFYRNTTHIKVKRGQHFHPSSTLFLCSPRHVMQPHQCQPLAALPAPASQSDGSAPRHTKISFLTNYS